MNPLTNALAPNAVFQQWRNARFGTVEPQNTPGGLPAGKRPGGARAHGLDSGTVQVLGALTCIPFHGHHGKARATWPLAAPRQSRGVSRRDKTTPALH